MWTRRWATAPRVLRPWQFIRRQSANVSPSSSISAILLSRARALAAEHAQLSTKLQGQYDASTAKKAGSLAPIANALSAWEAANSTLPELTQLINDPHTDSELRSLAVEDLSNTHETLTTLSISLQTSLTPPHPFAALPCLVEIRPGAGGDEAAIFAGDLLRMYIAFCKAHFLRTNLLSLETEAASGSDHKILEAVLEIDAPGAYDRFRCETGVHRVQRVPATETKGRTHTSAVSVLVLPSFPDTGNADDSIADFDDPSSDYHVDTSEVRIETMRARGAGGQHVNMTDSAVRLTHIPTGTVVGMQDQRSQQKNRAKAWQILRAKLAQIRREAREEAVAALRGGRRGMGRGDKVRTYNWSQQRVTDHRVGLTVHGVDGVMAGGEGLEKIMEGVRGWLKGQALEALLVEEEAEERKRAKER